MVQAVDETDREIVERARHGDREAFDELVRRHFDAIVRAGRRVVFDYHLAQDLAQEALMRAYQRASYMRPERPFVAWVSRIAKNIAIDKIRRRRVRYEAPLNDELAFVCEACVRETPLELDPPAGDPLEGLWRAVADLAEPERRVLLMRYGRGLDLRVIAQECGITVELVKTRLHRGRALLAASLRHGRTSTCAVSAFHEAPVPSPA